MAHDWKAGELAKCVRGFDSVPEPGGSPEVKVGGQYMVVGTELEPCPVHGSHLWLHFVGLHYLYEADHFVPVVPQKEEPKRLVREREDA